MQASTAGLVADFRQYLVTERGLAARTIEHYTDAARIFLEARCKEDDRPAGGWTAADVLRFIQCRAQVRRPVHMQQLCVGLRSFLRYLRFSGATERDLASSIPRIAHWRLATIPKSLAQAQVQTVLAHCDRGTAVGRRNFAILLLLSRLGLRANEVRCLLLEDIDWAGGQLTIRGKGRGPEPMPLPTDVGEALAAYLSDGRPTSTSRIVFLRAVPPYTQLVDGTVSSIICSVVTSAGIQVPSRGAHIFRHTLATQMLRGGATLREIGQLMRHRDEDTTRIYAKVDLARLRTLAMPWLGGAA